MTHNAAFRLTGKQIVQLADGLLSAFSGFYDLARLVRFALDERLNEIVDQQARFTDQVFQLVEWANARGKVQDLFRAAVEEVPGNAQLREAVVGAFGDAALGDSPPEQPRGRAGVEAKLAETHEAVLALREQVREQMQQLLDRVGMTGGLVRPQDSFSIRGEEERRAVKALLDRFRQLPPEEQRRLPDLLNDLGKLQVGSGDFQGARQTFEEAAGCTPESSAKAQAHYNAYWAALEQQGWDEALAAILEAASLDPQRFAPFPLHRYRPLRILGAGGFGTAFLCRDEHFDTDVVVKTLHASGLARTPEEVFREARVLHRLSDPAIIGVHDCDYADRASKARPYIVMDHFPGQSLQAYVRQNGPLSPDDVLAVARQVAGGMQAAHGRGILHRDLKPDNVLVRRDGEAWSVKVIDFGLARQEQVSEAGLPPGPQERSVLTTSVAGTLSYAPPEQSGRLPGVGVGPYSDVYSFARTCCYALLAVPEPDAGQWRMVPEPLAGLLRECGAEVPGGRPQDFKAVLERLDQLPCGRGLDLAVPGRWLTRPANEPQAEWELLGETPGRVVLLSRQVYRLEVAPGVTDGDLGSLAQMRGLAALQSLDLGECWRVTDAGLAHLAGLAGLRSLGLRRCWQVTGDGLAHLAGLAGLQHLDLGGCGLVGDDGLAHLADLAGLQHLDLTRCRGVTDAGLARLAGLAALQHLDLTECRRVTDAGLAHLKGLTALRHLDLEGCYRVTDAGVARLAGLAGLQHLSLAGCGRVTDAGVAHLAGLAALRHLNLGLCGWVTDAGLAHLAGLTALQHLGLVGCRGVTYAGRGALQAALPRCRIL